MVILSYVGVFIAGGIAGFFCMALMVGVHNSNYSVEEHRKEEEPDEKE